MQDESLKSLICLPETPLHEVLKIVNNNKKGIVFVVDAFNVVLGTFTDGDFRRYTLSSQNIDMNVKIQTLINKDFKRFLEHEDLAFSPADGRNGIELIPIVDIHGRLKKIVSKDPHCFSIAGREIGNGNKVFIIAEIGNNHQGSLKTAKQLIKIAANSGVDCVKFQMRTMSDIYGHNVSAMNKSVDLGCEYTLDLLAKFQLSDEEMFEAFDYSIEKGLIPLCTPWDIKSLLKLEKYGLSAYKIASADFTNHSLLEATAAIGKPFICSTGMTNGDEIIESINLLDQKHSSYALLHCNSTYPAPFKDVNLDFMQELFRLTNRPVGYSGHERGFHIPIAAVALGASIIEKHITLDRSQEGTDHKVSLLPCELESMVEQIRQTELALGSFHKRRELTQGEMINRENLAKSLAVIDPVDVGQAIVRSNIEIKSPGTGLQPNKINEVVGKIANRFIEAGSFLYQTDISGNFVKSSYHFTRPFGVPVRYHDFRRLVTGTNLDFVEFHLSYKDFEIDEKDFREKISCREDLKFAVHCPELFCNDNLLDLSSENPGYRQTSIDNLSKVIRLTQALNKYFPQTTKPVIVVNAGGWCQDGFLDKETKKLRYSLVADSLRQLDTNNVTIAIQTMPPFPWHFGGQSFHNLFIDADEIVNFCNENENIRICFDSSHSMMACNYFGWNFEHFVTKISPFIVHMHIGDASGIDGEGIKMGDGDIDFKKLFTLLSTLSPHTPFLPETWQGHINDGDGFWSELKYLETVCREK